MLFKRELAVKIAIGEKTQTRRIVKENETCDVDNHTRTVRTGNKIKWQVGRCYGVQIKRGGFSVNQFKLISIRKERACDITNEDAIAEGFAGRDEFFAVWKAINGKDTLEAMTWVLSFKPIFMAGKSVLLEKCTYADMQHIALPARGVLELSLSGSDIFWLNINDKRYSVHPDWLSPTGE